MGTDWLWWPVPTHPEIITNYYERVWPRREIKRMYEKNKFDLDEEEYDPDKKLFAEEQRQAAKEKMLVKIIVPLLPVLWFFFAKHRVLDIGLRSWGWTQNAVPMTADL